MIIIPERWARVRCEECGKELPVESWEPLAAREGLPLDGWLELRSNGWKRDYCSVECLAFAVEVGRKEAARSVEQEAGKKRKEKTTKGTKDTKEEVG